MSLGPRSSCPPKHFAVILLLMRKHVLCGTHIPVTPRPSSSYSSHMEYTWEWTLENCWVAPLHTLYMVLTTGSLNTAGSSYGKGTVGGWCRWWLLVQWMRCHEHTTPPAGSFLLPWVFFSLNTRTLMGYLEAVSITFTFWSKNFWQKKKNKIVETAGCSVVKSTYMWLPVPECTLIPFCVVLYFTIFYFL